jgi:hypothetical protein
MRNVFILYMPLNNVEAMVHYEDTITRRVGAEKIFSHVERSTASSLKHVFGNQRIPVWGSRDSPANRTKFDKMKPGDEVLIVVGPKVKLLARIAAKECNPRLSRELWHNLDGNNTAGWDLIYFLANPVEIDVPFSDVCALLSYKDDFQLRGFMSVAKDRLDGFYSQYDDFYSVLVAIREGRQLRKLDPNLEEADVVVAEDPRSLSSQIPLERNTEDHIWMQWTLLKLGRQAGENVWAPVGDRSRITQAHQFSEFETEFAAGLDTQTKYVENIDVVWKREFRIDAAFEVENSTSIYSGLLRFADLTAVAPNSHYPLFIVSPEDRKNRVREQLLRPSFRHLELPDRVRFLSYDKVREINDFVGDEQGGFTSDLLVNKSEKLTA